TNTSQVQKGTSHPNSRGVLQKDWKFHHAYEFHKVENLRQTASSFIQSPNDASYSNDFYPFGFGNQSTEAVERQAGVDNARYLWVTDEGYLRMIFLKNSTKTTNSTNAGVSKEFGTSSLYSNKFARGHSNVNYNTNGYNNVRIYPGMRIEVRARIRATIGTGLLPGIWLQGNESVTQNHNISEYEIWPDYGEIDIMENFSTGTHKNTIEQTFHLGGTTLGSGKSVLPLSVRSSAATELADAIDKFNIYWIEWVDEKTVRMGVNGAQTIELTEDLAKKNGATWPFDVKVNPDGLHFLLTMMSIKDAVIKVDSEMEVTHLVARENLKNNPDSKIPRMEIDWVRFYVDNSYATYAKDKPVFTGKPLY
ncbi:MAG: DUF5006 domain-containing protein, partial [Phocaeicola sp.]